MNQTISTPNRVEADLIIRQAVTAYTAEHGAETSGRPWGLLRLSLDVDLQKLLDAARLAEVVEASDALDRAENGTHEYIVRNQAGTVDNTAGVTDHLTGELTVAINHLLNASGYENGYVNGTGRDVLPKVA